MIFACGAYSVEDFSTIKPIRIYCRARFDKLTGLLAHVESCHQSKTRIVLT